MEIQAPILAQTGGVIPFLYFDLDELKVYFQTSDFLTVPSQPAFISLSTAVASV